MKIKILIFCGLIFISSSLAQIVYEPLNNSVYPFLERLSTRGIFHYDDIIKPLSRKYISEKLLEAKNKKELLTELEIEELEYYLRDYFLEIQAFQDENKNTKQLKYFEEDEARRYRIFSYSDDLFKINANPIIGLNILYPEKDRIIHSWLGLSTYGYLNDNIGFSLYMRSDNEIGDYLDQKKEFTPETGIFPDVSDNGKNISYAEIRSIISADWDWGKIVVAKDFIEYGYAKMGNLVLSSKAPSYPYISLKIKPVDWFSFTYFHGWLSSTVIDSLKLEAYHRDIYREKFIAWHSLTLTPLMGLDISLGESVVYSDKLELVYLMPVMVYYFADVFVSNRQNKPGDANQQIFLTVSSKNHLKNTHLYGTLFVDELTIGGINGTLFIDPNSIDKDNSRKRTQLGFTLGWQVTDLPLDNLTFTGEYTKINPFVYGHHDPGQVYTSSGYLMGHWMGHNSDLIYMDLNYRILRGLQVNIWGAYLRKGSTDYSGQY